MRAETTTILKRLSKGKSALTTEQLVEFCRDVGTASAQQIADAVAKKAAPKKSTPKAGWLLDMEAAKKKLSWTSAAEAVRKLVEIASDEGFIAADIFATRKTLPSFAVAAKRIAEEVGGERLAESYVREIDRLEREFRLG